MKNNQLLSLILALCCTLILPLSIQGQSYVPAISNKSKRIDASESNTFKKDSTSKWKRESDSLGKKYALNPNWFYVNKIRLYGSGNVLGLATASEDADQNTIPTGSLGLNFETNKISIDLFYSLNGRQEVEVNTLAQYGNTIINPNLGGESLNLNIRAKILDYFSAITSLKIADNLYNINDEKIDGSPVQARLGISFHPFDFESKPNAKKVNTISASLDIMYARRSFLGDVRNQEILIDDNRIFNKSFDGIDVLFRANINSVGLFTQISFNTKKGLNIPGFSGTQVLFGIDISGDS